MKNKILLAIGVISLLSCGESTNEDQDLLDLVKKKESISEESKKLDEQLSSYLTQYKPIPEKIENPNNLYSDEKLKLGHHLYFDSALSLTGNNSCNSCHNLSSYGVDNLPTSVGDNGGTGTRNSPTVLNAALHSTQFWDGRAKDVEEQAGMPILNPVEMAIPNEKYLEDKLSKIEKYKKLFVEAFPNDDKPFKYENIVKSIAVFERQLLTPSKFDKYLKGNKGALNEQEKRGFLIFNQTGCNTCHSGALLGGNLFQKFGVYDDYWNHTNSKTIDKGKAEVTKSVSDEYIFKTPALRNIEKTGPYFHDGSVESLTDAVKIMAKIQLNKELSEEETADVVVFLKSLTGDIKSEFKKAPKQL